MRKGYYIWIILVALDVLCWSTVPPAIRNNPKWSQIPGCGYILAIEYHFGNKIK